MGKAEGAMQEHSIFLISDIWNGLAALDPGPARKKKDDIFAVEVSNQSFKQKSSFWGWGLFRC